MQIVVLGAGMVGAAIAKDLAAEQDFQVTAVDLNQQAVERLSANSHVNGVRADIKENGRVAELVSGAGLVVSAVPGFMGFETLRQVIEAGKNVVDISFFGEDPFLLDGLARERGVTAVVDCGVAPGLCNIIAGYAETIFDKIDRYVCYVGGLPLVRQWPFEYKAVFSPHDVLEEYTRPARLVEYSQLVVRPALSEVELIDFPDVGTLEAFNTDGLRSLSQTMDIPFMREKTMRYPGHANLVRVFRESGFFDTTPIEVDGQMVKPFSLTSRLLFDQWRLEENEADLTVMLVTLEGIKNGARCCHNYFLLDRYDQENGVTSMARTTGYTCSIVARQVARGLFEQKGICPPEYLGRVPGCYHYLLEAYKKRNIFVQETVIDPSQDRTT
ncbi:MAG: saccharopine dehydrogenase NADP-binding domain-containing protein [Anaerolineales bacterium]|nr:saccharopine dehydrogenase NADP-binding domain-containing protein [Anaerolineales bacterium]